MIETPSEAPNSEKSESVVLTVEQLNRQIRQMLEGQFSLVWIQGEISNFKAHTSGHFYFSLKDSKSQISAVMFRGHNSRLKFKPADGLSVLVRCRVTVYEPRGNYQLAVEQMEPVGAGALQKAYEQLKLKLKTEGLFEAGRKRPLPAYPRHIGIVTSPTGAAIQDMMNVLERRNKMVPVTLVPTLVQGEGSAQKIIEALEKAWRLPNVDVIIVGRGGGSIEDLWAFNDEALARAIAASPVPVISAVGHEVDFTIADFVADLRAPTPSAAAELVVKNSFDLALQIKTIGQRLMLAIRKKLEIEQHRLSRAGGRLVDPKRRLQDLSQRRDELVDRLQNASRLLLERKQMKIKVLESRLVSPLIVVQKLRARAQQITLRLSSEVASHLQGKNAKFRESAARLDALSPLKTLDRGYSIVLKNKKVVTKPGQVAVGDQIRVQIGTDPHQLVATVEEIVKGELNGF
jgi:exodeoxyribonuclease VII large subunit